MAAGDHAVSRVPRPSGGCHRSRARLRMAYITRDLDQESTVAATQVRWIRALAQEPRVASVDVLAGRYGSAALPDNVAIHVFGGRRLRLARFVGLASAMRPRIDCYFVAQGGPFPALLLPQKLLWGGRPIFQWKAHAVVSRRMRFYARYCDDLIFTASESSLPLESTKKRVIGHGIDCVQFNPIPEAVTASPNPAAPRVLSLGRISPIKNVDVGLEILAQTGGCHAPTLDLVGPSANEYTDHLRQRAAELGIAGRVRFMGSVHHDDLPELIPHYHAAINLSDGALDKAALECLACGVPVLTSNRPLLESLPSELSDALSVEGCSAAGAATKLQAILRMTSEERGRLAQLLRSVVVQHHSLENFFTKIINEVESWQNEAARGR